MPYSPKLAFGTILKRGDGGAGAVKATLTHSTSDQQMVFTAKTAGTAGNSITVAITNNATLAVEVTGTAIAITADTSAHTVNDVIAAIYQSAAASALIDVTDGAGDGSGLVVALSATALADGANSAEVFTEIQGVSNISRSGPSREEVDVTNHSSPAGAIQTLPEGIYDPGSLNFELFFDPSDETHAAFATDFLNATIGNYQLVTPATIGITFEFQAWVKNLGEEMPLRGAYSRNTELRITGPVTEV